MKLKKAFSIFAGDKIGQCRAVPVRLGRGEPKAFLAAHSAVFDVDPYGEMFFFPEDTLKLTVFDETGRVLWSRDLGKGVIPGVWFCPVLAFDLDGDGADEIWLVDNRNAAHPLGSMSYTLTCLEGKTGKVLRSIPWPKAVEMRGLPMSEQFRHFIIGGEAHGKPVLVTAQGTYSDMYFQGWGPDLELLWEKKVAAADPGARGSHMCPVLDCNGDGVDELLWGERCIALNDGHEVFCADRDSYRGHSDIILPVAVEDGSWRFFTCRETDDGAAPRICLYDGEGKRLWGHLERGHIDLGWVARLGPGGERYAMGIRIGGKTCGPDGRFHDGVEEFVYGLESGEAVKLGYSVYKTLPVDLNGDGVHELVRGLPGAGGDVLDARGEIVASVGGAVALSGKLLNRAGEQLLVYGPDGLSLWCDEEAEDTPAALARYASPFYQKALSVQGNGYNWCILGGFDSACMARNDGGIVNRRLRKDTGRRFPVYNR